MLIHLCIVYSCFYTMVAQLIRTPMIPPVLSVGNFSSIEKKKCSCVGAEQIVPRLGITTYGVEFTCFGQCYVFLVLFWTITSFRCLACPASLYLTLWSTLSLIVARGSLHSPKCVFWDTTKDASFVSPQGGRCVGEWPETKNLLQLLCHFPSKCVWVHS